MDIELKRAFCTQCGQPLEVDIKNRVAKCPVCGNTFFVTHAIDLSVFEEIRIKDIKNRRELLTRAVKFRDANNIREHSNAILSILPNDFSANYYFAYAEKLLGKPRYYDEFLKECSPRCATLDESSVVLSHILSTMEYRDYGKVEAYIKRLFRDETQSRLLGKLDAVADLHREEEENYTIRERDVFVCYQSTDTCAAFRVVDALERNGYECWISGRNIKKSSEHYWDDIYGGIDNCKAFLVIASSFSMNSPDCNKEMNYAHKQKKVRVEYKLDTVARTPAFEGFFGDQQWVDGYTDEEMGIMALVARIGQALTHDVEKAEELQQQQALAQKEAEERRLKEEEDRIRRIASETAKNNYSPNREQVITEGLEKASALKKIGKHENAKKIFDELIDEYPNDARAYFEAVRLLTKEFTDFKDTSHEWYWDSFKLFANSEQFANALSIYEVYEQSIKRIREEANEAALKRSTDAQKRAYENLIQAEERSSLNAMSISGGVLYKFNKRKFKSTDLRIPREVNSIGKGVFNGCAFLERVIIPDTVSVIGDEAFSGCTAIGSIIIPKGVKAIGENAFRDCKSLTTVTISENVTNISRGAFLGCDKLESIDVDISNPAYSSLGGVLFNNDKSIIIQYPRGNTAKNYTIPSAVKGICSMAFHSCYNLNSITVPMGVTGVGEKAFKDCSGITSMSLPDSITSISDRAFAGCCSLISITIPVRVAVLGASIFEGCIKLERINCRRSRKPADWNSDWNRTKDGLFGRTKVKWSYKGRV